MTASFYPLEYLAEQIGGDHVAVTDLTKPGVEPHDLELTPRQTAALGQADVDRLPQGAPARRGRRDQAVRGEAPVDAATLTRLEDHGTEVGRPPPHHRRQRHRRRRARTRRRPAHLARPGEVRPGRQGCRQGAASRPTRPTPPRTPRTPTRWSPGSTRWTPPSATGLRNRTSDTFVTTHAAFGYLAERYGLVEEAINGIDPESEPSAARMKALHDLARSASTSPRSSSRRWSATATAKTLAGDLRLKTDVLDPIEGITDKSKGSDYFAGAAQQPRRRCGPRSARSDQATHA